MGWSRSVLIALVAALLVTAACEPAAPVSVPRPPSRDSSTAAPGTRGWFEGGSTWFGDLGDPHVIRVGSTYYAYGSPTGGRNLPVLTSTDLVTWKVHKRWSSADFWASGYDVTTDPAIPAEIRGKANAGWGTYVDSARGRYDMNDALVRTSSWGVEESGGNGWLHRIMWAPGVARIGSTWFAYSAVKVSATADAANPFGRFCITVASAASPRGPFRDVSGSGPIQCQPASADPAGSIDPYPFVDTATGKAYLLWKATGKSGSHPSAVYSVELGTNGRPRPGAAPVKLLATNEGGWEGTTIENPAMVLHGGRYYLFYSANWFGLRNGRSPYATGYAVCAHGPRAACTRMTVSAPLLASTATEYGPGGASPFVDTSGHLRLAYAFFWPGESRNEFGEYNGRHPRRLNVATLTVQPGGKLTATRRAWKPGA